MPSYLFLIFGLIYCYSFDKHMFTHYGMCYLWVRLTPRQVICIFQLNGVSRNGNKARQGRFFCPRLVLLIKSKWMAGRCTLAP